MNVDEIKQLVVYAEDFFSRDFIAVATGDEYQLWWNENARWKDWFVSTTPDGYFNLFAWIYGMRKKSAKCFSLCVVFNQNDNTSQVVKNKTIINIPRNCTEMYFFANDAKAKKYYRNNSGSINIYIKRLK